MAAIRNPIPSIRKQVRRNAVALDEAIFDQVNERRGAGGAAQPRLIGGR